MTYAADLMRITGYTVLIFGFLWLAVWCGLLPGQVMRGIAEENFKKYPDSGKFSGAETQDAIISVLKEYKNKAPGVLLPATLMFAGGILLDAASRRGLKHIEVTKEDSKTPDH